MDAIGCSRSTRAKISANKQKYVHKIGRAIVGTYSSVNPAKSTANSVQGTTTIGDLIDFGGDESVSNNRDLLPDEQNEMETSFLLASSPMLGKRHVSKPQTSEQSTPATTSAKWKIPLALGIATGALVTGPVGKFNILH